MKRNVSLSLLMVAAVALQTGTVGASQYAQRAWAGTKGLYGRGTAFTGRQAARFRNWMSNSKVADYLRKARAGQLSQTETIAGIASVLGIAVVTAASFYAFAMRDAGAPLEKLENFQLISASAIGDIFKIGALLEMAEKRVGAPQFFHLQALDFAYKNLAKNPSLDEWEKQSLRVRLAKLIQEYKPTAKPALSKEETGAILRSIRPTLTSEQEEIRKQLGEISLPGSLRGEKLSTFE